MRRNARSRTRSLRWRAGLLLLVVVLLVNGLAFVQARAATSFVPDGASLEALLTQPLPQQLGALLTGVRIPPPAEPLHAS